MTLFLEKISLFNSKHNIESGKLIRFAFPINDLCYESIIDSLIEHQFFFFSKPADEYKLLGIGEINPADSASLIAAISSDSVVAASIVYANHEVELTEEIPLVLGAEKFLPDSKEKVWSDFENSKWFIPQILLIKRKENSFIIFNYLSNEPPLQFYEQILELINRDNVSSSIQTEVVQQFNSNYSNWNNSVNSVLKDIELNNVEKVVLARRVQIQLRDTIYVPKILMELQNKYPDCATFAYKEKGSLFFGATPETLFSLKNKELQTEALAGSISRGKNNEEDLLNESLLLSNQKEINEHKSVLNFLLQKLEAFSEDIHYKVKPNIKKLANIQHLQTPISAKLKNNVNILELQKALHPTPAVCGLPQKKALELIKDLEYFDRGLYAGVIGWFNEKRRAEFVVGLRCALLSENLLTAFAGCGIVEGSDPVAEFNETELKFKPILSLLENEIISQS